MIDWDYPDSHDLKLSNRPVRIRMPGGVAGVQFIRAAPYADPDRAGSRVFLGFLRKPADCTSQPSSPFRATFHSLLAIPRSDLAPLNWPEVRKGPNFEPYISTSYARTNQAVGLQHRIAKETAYVVFCR